MAPTVGRVLLHFSGWHDECMTLSYPEQVIIYKQEALKAAGVIQDDGLGTKTTFSGLVCRHREIQIKERIRISTGRQSTSMIPGVSVGWMKIGSICITVPVSICLILVCKVGSSLCRLSLLSLNFNISAVIHHRFIFILTLCTVR